MSVDDRDGKLLLFCFSGCSTNRICAAAGLRLGDLFPPSHDRRPAPARKAVALEAGSVDDLRALCALRSIGLEGVRWAADRGVLRFGTLRGCRAWIVTDSTRRSAQARRLDGLAWEHIGAKAWTLPGSAAAWPIGIEDAKPFPCIALCEGGPDFLAAHYLGLWEQASHYRMRDVRCAPVAMLGASMTIHPEALPLFAGKRVRIFAHADAAGTKAASRWFAQLSQVGASVDCFSFGGLTKADGSQVKDLNDHLLTNDPVAAERILP